MLANDIFFWKYLFYSFILTFTKYWLSWMKLSQNYIIRWIFEIYRSGLKTVILSEKIQHFNFAPHWDRDRTNPIWSWDSVGNFEWYLWSYALHFKISLNIHLHFQVKSLWRITLKCRETYWHDDKYGCHFAFFLLSCRMAVRKYFSSEDVHICLLLPSIVHYSAWSC